MFEPVSVTPNAAILHFPLFYHLVCLLYPQGNRYLDNVHNEMPMILSRIRKHQWQHLVEFGQLCQCLVDNYCLHVEASEVLSPQSVCRPIG